MGVGIVAWRRVLGLNQAVVLREFRARTRGVGGSDRYRDHRRRRLTSVSATRFRGRGGGAMEVQDVYRSMQRHKELFDTKKHPWIGGSDDWLDPLLLESVNKYQEDKNGEAFNEILHEEAPGIYSFPIFTPEFCQMLIDEMKNYTSSGLPARRPNSMNNYGLIINDIGLKERISELQRIVLQPISAHLFPIEGSQFDDHHSFVVQYKQGEDLGLDMHTDDSEVTFNICLTENFQGSGLTFCGKMATASHRKHVMSYQHKLGRAVVHLGKQRHGADDITGGERRNLIIWNHNRHYRQQGLNRIGLMNIEKEQGPPDLECLSYTHDRDYAMYKAFPNPSPEKAAITNLQSSWCPPSKACYDTMEPIDYKYMPKEVLADDSDE